MLPAEVLQRAARLFTAVGLAVSIGIAAAAAIGPSHQDAFRQAKSASAGTTLSKLRVGRVAGPDSV